MSAQKGDVFGSSIIHRSDFPNLLCWPQYNQGDVVKSSANADVPTNRASAYLPSSKCNESGICTGDNVGARETIIGKLARLFNRHLDLNFSDDLVGDRIQIVTNLQTANIFAFF